ncbi:MAG: dihydrofolate reductase [Polyangiaceae bacterium]|nr:dihydrofolate reductase [Polyangiaceae bacterium]
MPILSLIYAVSSNGVIGKEGGLPWHYPEDLKYFKRITNGHTVIMGRKTFDSVGRPLPGRCNIVVSKESAKHEANFRTRQDAAPLRTDTSLLWVNSLDAALAKVPGDETEVFVIGGRAIYEEALRIATRVYRTEIAKSADGDVYFPPFPTEAFRESSREAGVHPDLQFVTLERI